MPEIFLPLGRHQTQARILVHPLSIEQHIADGQRQANPQQQEP